MMMTIEQRRAADALARARTLADEVCTHFDDKLEQDNFLRRYRAYVERLGPAIVINGLGQALATELAAAGKTPTKPKDKAHFELHRGVEGWLCREQGGVYPGASDLLGAIVGHSESKYLRAQAEALAWLEWHKKFCRARFPRGEE